MSILIKDKMSKKKVMNAQSFIRQANILKKMNCKKGLWGFIYSTALIC